MANLTFAAILLSISAFGFYSLHDFGQRNGLYDLVSKTVASGVMPGTGTPIKTNFINVEPIDHALVVLNVFFGPTSDHTRPGLSLFLVNFAGGLGGLWVLVMIESMRGRWLAALVPFITGIGVQLMGIGFFGPLYAALHLLMSSTANAPATTTATASSLLIRPRDLAMLPASMTLGYLLPTLMAPLFGLPGFIAAVKPLFDGLGVTVPSAQDSYAFWQPWPIYVSAIQLLLNRVVFVSAPYARPPTARATRSALRTVYGFALLLTAPVHVVFLATNIAAELLPGVLNPTIVDSLRPAATMLAPAPWDATARVTTVAEGAHWFLLYDYFATCAGFVVWTWALLAGARKATQTRMCLGNLLALVGKFALISLIGGFTSGAVFFMWLRDELVLGEQIEQDIIEESAQLLKEKGLI